ncbi:GTP-binding protein [Candidatus Woesearchaeota archaeon]|nr:MAG: GTP-binding protein [Candidatus Woesearchaeota archaeon]
MDEHEKIRELEAALSKTKYNKATEGWFALIKSQIAKLREKIEKKSAGKKGGEGWFVKKTGNATVILVGFPSVGKSTLLNALTGVKSKAAAYEFTTLDCIPGTMRYKHARIQILDVPGIIEGAASGRGRGKEVLAMARSADLVLYVIDATHPEHYPLLKKEVFDVGIRTTGRAPDVKIKKKPKGGLSIASTVPLDIERKTLASILKAFRIMNADVVIRDKIDIDQFIDAIEGNRAYCKALVCITKADLIDAKRKKQLEEDFPGAIFVSAEKGEGIEELKEAIYKKLDLARIYLKEVNKKPDLDVPLILTRPVTLRAVCEHIHRDFVKKFRYARLWGASAKYPGQQIRNLDKELEDGTIVEIHVR